MNLKILIPTNISQRPYLKIKFIPATLLFSECASAMALKCYSEIMTKHRPWSKANRLHSLALLPSYNVNLGKLLTVIDWEMFHPDPPLRKD